MLVIAGYVRLAPGQREHAIGAALEMMQKTRSEPGCKAYDFSADLTDPDLFRIFEEWESADALTAHFASEHMKTFQTALSSLQVEELRIQRYEVSSVGPVR